MIHHVTLGATDLERSGRFYDAVLGTLGWRRHAENEALVSWGIVRPIFYAERSDEVSPGGGHVCFTANGIPAVKGAWENGTTAGGTSDGEPGARPEYGAGYYSAFLIDPDGHRVEIAVGNA